TWEVKANSRAFNSQFKTSFLCWQRQKYKSNVIHTAKYNVFSFLPLSLYEQFHRVSNLYFLFIIILQGFPEISTLPWFTLFAPLVCLLTIRATRDLVDDIVSVAGGRGLGRAGVGEGQGAMLFPPNPPAPPQADLLLLASTEPSSLCYVETADIDGETNLKFRQAPPVTHLELTSIRNMASFQGKVVCEEPNSRMHHFVGCLEWNGRKHPLDSGNMLLRGCRVRNTDTCYGMVIYAGFDTKIMKNCGRIHQKRTKIDRLMNKLVMLVRGLPWGRPLGRGCHLPAKHHYVSSKHLYSVAAETFLIFWGFLTQLSVMVPMAMVEFIYLGNSIFINWDVQMYHAPQDEPAKARSTSLNDQLGQVEYIFSDKTGTLTQNVMTFKKCCIGGVIYGGSQASENPYLWNKFADGKLLYRNERLLCAVRHNEDKVVREFWRLLAICHTVMVQEKDNQLVYQAASPDEEALVTAARNFGYVFLARTQDSITVMELGEKRVYQVLAMMDFNSIRKRMSVLVRNPEGSIYLYTKGADVVIFERLHKKGMKEWATEEALASFAEETLRTLCLAYKEVDEDMYEEWRQRHQEASILLQNRAHALHQVYEEMEQGLQLLGATAIEDRLQDGVCDTIKCLKQGNIKVWVLTGDKQGGSQGGHGRHREKGDGWEKLLTCLERHRQPVPLPRAIQAVLASDYSFSQFKFLQRLLLVHGRWSYVRVCKFLRCFIYKTVASMMVQVWFAFYSGFTAQPLYEGWFLALFNLLYSTLPVLYIGLFEQDVSAQRSLELPQLYTAGQKDELFNYWVFLQALAHGTVTSLVNFFVTLWVSHDSAGPVSFSDYQSFAVVVAMSGLLSITMEVGRAATLSPGVLEHEPPRCPRSATMPGGLSRCHSWSLGVDLPTSTEPCAGLLAVPWPDSPPTLRSRSSSGTGRSCPCWPSSSASASMCWQLGPPRVSGSSKSHPAPSRFCVSPPVGNGVAGPGDGCVHVRVPAVPLSASLCSRLHRGDVQGGRCLLGSCTRVSWGQRERREGGCQEEGALSRLPGGSTWGRTVTLTCPQMLTATCCPTPPSCWSFFSKHPAHTGPACHLPSPQEGRPPGEGAGVSIPHSWDPLSQSLCWEQKLQDMGRGVGGVKTQAHIQCPEGDQITGPRVHAQMIGAWGSR
uniref:Phospholipid-transporting ATPase n=1 Tax=Ursus maritimus TaxID=29073 RepID=A0A452TIB3_URSMA